MAVGLFINPIYTFKNASGSPLAGGKVYTYVSGTTTLLSTYGDSEGASTNANPIILDSAGSCVIYLAEDTSYKFVIKDSSDNTLYTIDPVINNKEVPATGIVTAEESVTDYYALSDITMRSNSGQTMSLEPNGTGVTVIEDLGKVSSTTTFDLDSINLQLSNGEGFAYYYTPTHNVVRIAQTANAVNYIEIVYNSDSIDIKAAGDDTNIDLVISASASTIMYWGLDRIFTSTDGSAGQYLKYNSGTTTMEFGA